MQTSEFIDSLIEGLDLLLNKYASNDISGEAMKMLLRYELGQYISNQIQKTSYKISEKGLKVCSILYQGLKDDMQKEMLKFGLNPIEIDFSSNKILSIFGQELIKRNNLDYE